MTDAGTPHVAVAGPGFPRLALGLAWVCSSLAAGAVGWGLSGTPGRGTGFEDRLLLGLAVLGLVTACAVASNRHRALTLTFSIIVSAICVLAGAAVLVVAATRDGALGGDVLVAALVLAGGGVVSGSLGRRARSMSKPWR